ncbi:MAG: tetratricopeptide repeat protein [Longimicrobiales bacterium]
MGLAWALGACGDPETAMARGDRLWADSSYAEALAEYRLGYQRNQGSDELLARVAHAYAVSGEFQRAQQYYGELLKRSPNYTDQAIFDYLTLAKQAQARSDRYGLAGAVEAAVVLRPGLPVSDLAAGLGRYYTSTGDSTKALEYYERALGAAPPDSVAGLLFEIATLHETRGNCADAITMFNAFRARTNDGEKADQARWHVGSCAWNLARKAVQSGDTARALAHMKTVTELGVPQNVLEEVWFHRGELLLGQGRRDEALESYIRSLDHNRTGTGQLADRARRRIDELRFGR